MAGRSRVNSRSVRRHVTEDQASSYHEVTSPPQCITSTTCSSACFTNICYTSNSSCASGAASSWWHRSNLAYSDVNLTSSLATCAGPGNTCSDHGSSSTCCWACHWWIGSRSYSKMLTNYQSHGALPVYPSSWASFFPEHKWKLWYGESLFNDHLSQPLVTVSGFNSSQTKSCWLHDSKFQKVDRSKG